jgi:FtsP/CotA-like multicopper oxidase with cupredoxin domain
VRTRRFELGDTSINDRKMDLGRIDAVVEAGTTEIWEVHNASGMPHNFHPHDIRFRIVEYANGPPPAQLTGPKDTVYVAPGETVRFVARFGDYGDPDTPYMFHCHLLQHEDRGMMGQFAVVAPGQEPRDLAHEHSGDGP